MAASQNISGAQRYLANVQFPYCAPPEVETLNKVSCNVPCCPNKRDKKLRELKPRDSRNLGHPLMSYDLLCTVNRFSLAHPFLEGNLRWQSCDLPCISRDISTHHYHDIIIIFVFKSEWFLNLIISISRERNWRRSFLRRASLNHASHSQYSGARL